MRKRTVLSLVVVFVPVLAVATASPSADADTRTICRAAGPNVETCHIDEPVVNSIWHEYPAIKLSPCDKVTIRAGGCVQTGGHGKTWKRYVDPIGGGSNGLYAGLVSVPGVFTGNWQQDCGGLTCDHSAKRLRDVVGVPFTIPHDVGAGAGTASHPNGPRSLTLGYADDVYRDNSYSGHDDGTNDQCKNVGNAFVDVTIEHAASCPAQQSDGVRDGDETDVDCGGTIAAKCADGKHCSQNGDCANGICSGGTCQAKAVCPTGSPQRFTVRTQVCSAWQSVVVAPDTFSECGVNLPQSRPVVGLSPSGITGVGARILGATATDQNGNATIDVEACGGCGSVGITYNGFKAWGIEGATCWSGYVPSTIGGLPPAHTLTSVHAPPPPPPPPHHPPPPPPHGGGRTQRQ